MAETSHAATNRRGLPPSESEGAATGEAARGAPPTSEQLRHDLLLQKQAFGFAVSSLSKLYATQDKNIISFETLLHENKSLRTHIKKQNEEINRLKRKLSSGPGSCGRPRGPTRGPAGGPAWSWALRHSRPGPGLCELVLYSGLYVEQSTLDKGVAFSVDYETSMRMLLEGLLTPYSFGRGPAHATLDPRLRLVDKHLYSHIKRILLIFLEHLGAFRGWGSGALDSVIESIDRTLDEQFMTMLARYTVRQ